MKKCPTCNRTYADETLTFCLADGSLLSAPHDLDATQHLPASHVLDRSRSLKERHIITKVKLLLLTFFILASLATLFPPFHWEVEAGQPIPSPNVSYKPLDLPQKYAFLFDDPTQEIITDDLETVTFTRSLLINELILEYIIAFLIALLVQVVVLKTKSLVKRRA